MRKLLPALFFCLCYPSLDGQEVKWAVNTPTPTFASRLVTDATSNVYMYGSSENLYRPDLEGSVLRKYSNNGELLFTKEWKEKFFLTHMVNDRKGHFYFCGRFHGDISHAGYNLHSQGNADALVGKMDEQGNVEWAIGFGGKREDYLNSITFNSDSTELVITGSVDSTIILYEYEVNTPPRSIFVGRMTLTGEMLLYRTYDFTSNEYGDNRGLEIAPDGKGGYYLLADRMGDHWSNEAHPTGSPMEGRYVFSLNGDLEIKWSRFIISSSCYYGYSCNGMGIQNGSPCVPSFCSGKYGGNGKLEKLDGSGGTTSFSISNTDGSYYDTYANGNNLLYVGNEEADGCPCESNNPGFARVKILDDHNVDRVILSKYAFHFYNIVQAPNGNIYVFGETDYKSDLQLQGHPLSQGYFLFAMSNPSSNFEVSEPSEKLLTAFPNPSTDYVEIVDDNLMSEVIVMNSAGVIIQEMAPNAKSCTIKNLLPGYYIVRAKNSGGYRSGKILVMK